MPEVDFEIKNHLWKKKKHGGTGNDTQKYLERFSDRVTVFTDRPKDPETGWTGAAVCIPGNKVNIKKRSINQSINFNF